jgi:hypothetical protein
MDAISSKAVHDVLDTKKIENEKCYVNELYSVAGTLCQVSGHTACLFLRITIVSQTGADLSSNSNYAVVCELNKAYVPLPQRTATSIITSEDLRHPFCGVMLDIDNAPPG